jgi:hypothetical protein
MPENPKKSPAVKSLQKERAAQLGRDAKTDLDSALDDSFPASDPISMSSNPYRQAEPTLTGPKG